MWLAAFYVPYFIYIYLTISATKTLEDMQVTGELPTDTGSLMLTGVVGLAVLVLAVVLIIFFVRRGTAGDNRYGPDPYAGGEASTATA
jgi:uncharacterized membrane protein YhaH (DUF805 family)